MKSLKKLTISLIAILLITGCSSVKKNDDAKKDDEIKIDPNLLIEDSFIRADSTNVGSEWTEVKMINGTGSSVPLVETGDSLWSIKNNTLYYEGTGNNTYTEDYIETIKEYPINNTQVEFEMRGTVSTQLAYVGPAFFWAPATAKRMGGFTTIDNIEPLIGVQGFYGWESGGIKGMVYKLNGDFKLDPEGKLAGINGSEFVKHTIIIKDNKLTYKVAGTEVASYPLSASLPADAKRHFSFDVRYYDNGVLFKVEIKNLKITKIL